MIDVFARDLHEFQRFTSRFGGRRVDRRMGGLDQRGFAHAARAPKECVVGRQTGCETPCVVEDEVARTLDPLKKSDWHAIDLINGMKPHRRLEDEAIGRFEIKRSVALRREGFQREGNPFENRAETGNVLRSHGRSDPSVISLVRAVEPTDAPTRTVTGRLSHQPVDRVNSPGSVAVADRNMRGAQTQ